MQELKELPARVAGVELQIVQLREEMQAAFSALRSEFSAELHGEIGNVRGEVGGLRGEVGGLRGEVGDLRAEVHGMRDDLRSEIRAGDQETRNFMRALHEDTIARIATMGEGRT